ncbi:MAG: MMPL family transporter [Acidimicrobiia bacterium]|nr:MMPL family transporter [Acidimicrobiia bacterium]
MILILAFGSVLAMGLPIGTAIAGIGIGSTLTILVSNLLSMPEFAPTLAVMIGLGVGIDYALFIVTRYREELHRGHGHANAAGIALDTAGRAVLFAGTTVVISLAGMLLIGVPFVAGLGIGAALVVGVTMVASVTLLPALLGFAGHRVEVTRWRGLVAAGLVAITLVGVGSGFDLLLLALPLAAVVLMAGFFAPGLRSEVPPRRVKPLQEQVAWRWSRYVQRHPVAMVLVGLGVLVVLMLPVFSLRLAFSDEGNYPEETTTRQAYDLLSEGFGPGFNGPLLVVSRLPSDPGPGLQDRLAVTTDAISADGSVADVTGPVPNDPEQPSAGAVAGHPHLVAPVRRDRGARQPPAGRRPPRRVRGCGPRPRRLRVHRAGDRLLRLSRLAPSTLLRRGPRVQLRAAARRVPIDPRTAQGRGDEPPLHRRRLRHRRRALPVGLGRRPAGCVVRARRALRPDDAVRHRLRTLHGLRGLPPLAGEGGVRPPRRQRHRGGRRPGRHGPTHHRGRPHHDLRVRCLPVGRRPDHQALRCRSRDGHRPRRDGRPAPAGARHDGASSAIATGGFRRGWIVDCPGSTSKVATMCCSTMPTPPPGRRRTPVTASRPTRANNAVAASTPTATGPWRSDVAPATRPGRRAHTDNDLRAAKAFFFLTDEMHARLTAVAAGHDISHQQAHLLYLADEGTSMREALRASELRPVQHHGPRGPSRGTWPRRAAPLRARPPRDRAGANPRGVRAGRPPSGRDLRRPPPLPGTQRHRAASAPEPAGQGRGAPRRRASGPGALTGARRASTSRAGPPRTLVLA